MEKFIKIVEAINKKLGTITSWLTLLLVLIITYDVIVRYIFAVIFLLAAGYTFLMDDHVRVDVFYTRYSEKKKAITDLLGSLFFLIPFCVVGILSSLNFVEFSFKVQETSPDAGGLPARYILKSFIPIAFFILILQGIAVIFKSILKLKTDKPVKGLQN
jgi:TRAP-type mannitol/chloroaromatic compound transport system permease small subunit